MSAFCRPETIRVLIVDDHSLVREGLKALASSETNIEICGEAETAAGALAAIERSMPHVAVVDLTLKDGSGIQLIKDIKNRYDNVRIVVSSMHQESIYAQRVLQAGALAFVHKEEPSERIFEAIRHVMDGRIFVSDQVSNSLLTQAVGRPHAVAPSAVETLTNRELQVFELIGNGMATRKIAEQLHLSPKTIDTHRQKIREKLNLEDAAALTHFATQWAMDNQ